MDADSSFINIVLADDDTDEVFIFELALKKLPFRFKLRHAPNGEDLKQLLAETVPDILFLDVYMPGKGGLDTITEIRKDIRYDALPVIIYTSDRSEKYIDATYRHGANFCLEKTGSISELANKLRHVFSFDWKTQLVYPDKADYVI
jgi:DNA-binding NarL/FixJ family response regulator